MASVECRTCGRDAPYSHSDRRGDVHVCPKDHKTVYPMHTDE